MVVLLCKDAMSRESPGGLVLFLLFQLIAGLRAGRPCVPKFLSSTAMVCVCNATYCDTMDPVLMPPQGTFIKYTTSRAGQRLEQSEGTFSSTCTGSGARYTYNPFVHYQSIKGFGGAHTDASAINILKLSPASQGHLLRSYFSEEGIEYNLLRLPIGCSDFSTHAYSYNDCPDDFDLKCFRLASEDLKYRIPLLHRFLALSARPLSLVASPWTAPGWLKTNNDVKGKYRLKGKPGDRYHKTWAKYFIRFLDEYSKQNISFWAITPQNEPVFSVLLPKKDFPTMPCSPEEQRDFIILDLGPALKASQHRDVLLVIQDDTRFSLPTWSKVILGDSRSAQYVNGTAIHWYLDWLIPPGPTLVATHHLFPNFFLLYTESCSGYIPWQTKVDLGSWERGEGYSHSIITNLNSFVTGWIDWNMVLDMQGQPNFADNPVDSPVIVNPEKDEFYKQPMFYHLGHFSKFIPEKSIRVALTAISSLSSCWLQTAGFLRPDGNAVVVVLNKCSKHVKFSISDAEMGCLEDVAPPHSIQTYLWTRSL